MKFSIIIPVYNRPDEVDELLDSLCRQTKKNFEVVIVEDGSANKCKKEVEKYSDKLDIAYFEKENGGPASARNFGMKRAKYDYFIFFDSDCIIPEKYFEIATKQLIERELSAYGGPDAAHESFTITQKAISYAMTSIFTTGGIRGANEKMEKFKPRSFNMGYNRAVYEATNGFSDMRFGEDVDMSLRILAGGFSSGLIKDAFVFHKRRTDLKKFFKQVFNSGIARINLEKRHRGSLKLVHTLPALFVLGSLFLIICSFFAWFAILPLLIYTILIFIDALIQYKNLKVAFMVIPAVYTQLFGYGLGFITSFWRRIILKQDEFHAYKHNFYK